MSSSNSNASGPAALGSSHNLWVVIRQGFCLIVWNLPLELVGEALALDAGHVLRAAADEAVAGAG